MGDGEVGLGKRGGGELLFSGCRVSATQHRGLGMWLTLCIVPLEIIKGVNFMLYNYLLPQ